MSEKVEERCAEAVRQMEVLAAQSTMVVGSRDWTRDELHERRTKRNGFATEFDESRAGRLTK